MRNWGSTFTGQRQRDGQPEGERPLSYYRYDKDLFTSSEDPKLRKLYGNLPDEEFNEYWLSLVQEVVDEYSPDMIWFDSWLDEIPEEYRQRMAAHHFNAAEARNQEVALICKQGDMLDPGAAITVKHLADNPKVDLKIQGVTLLGADGKCDWTFEDGILNLVAPPATDANAIATVFKVQLK